MRGRAFLRVLECGDIERNVVLLGPTAHFRAKETVDEDTGITAGQQKGRDTLLLLTLRSPVHM